MQTASEASRSPALLLPEKAPVRTRRSPSYLYRKGNIFYFRYAFSAEERQRFQRSEIRISLRTGFIHEARKKARQLRAMLEGLMAKEQSMPSAHEIREKMLAELKTLMESCPQKNPPSPAAIRQRMDRMLKDMLDTMDAALYKPITTADLEADGIQEPGIAGELYFQFAQGIVNDPEALKSSLYPQAIYELLLHKYFEANELTPENIPTILNEYQKMQISLGRILQAREKGDYSYERSFETTSAKFEDREPVIEPTGPLLSEFIERYIQTKLTDGHWKLHSVPTHKNRLEILIEVLGNKPINNITREDMREYRDVLRKLPPNRKKKAQYKEKTIQEILEMAPVDTLNVKTINTTVEAAASMFEWGMREGILTVNPAKGLQIKDERHDRDKRDDFPMEDITKIFFSGDYTPENFIHPAYYWGPLIGLYTGMRLEEICQLHCADIIQEGSVWCFDINLNPSRDGTIDKLLKTTSAVRKVPIHNDLHQLGFLEHVEKMKRQGHERIFPELNKTEKTPKYGKQVSKAFSNWLKGHGITGKKTFHSLRHTFSHYFKTNKMHNDVFRQVFGHEIEELAGRVYGSEFSAEQCYKEIISQLRWGAAHDNE